MTCDWTCDWTSNSVPASSCQLKGMRCHDDAGTESQVESQAVTLVVVCAPLGKQIEEKHVLFIK
jgi:hypothetical protein